MTKTSYESDAFLGDLMIRVAQGDRRAFEIIYDETSPRFLAIITRMLRDPDRALDVLQDAYVSIWKNAASFDPDKGRAFTWMLVIMRNRALDLMRGARRSETTIELCPEIPDEGDDPETVARRRAIWQVMQRHMRALPADMAHAITLRICYGWAYQEIADVLTASPNTVKSWVRRGLSRLRHDMPVSSFGAVL